MRVLVGAATALLLMAAPAAAQNETGGAQTECAPFPEAPNLPDGATSDRAAMEAANGRYSAWAHAYQAGLACRRAEAEQLRAAWQASVADHNAAADHMNQTNARWEAEVAEFNGRSGQREEER